MKEIIKPFANIIFYSWCVPVLIIAVLVAWVMFLRTEDIEISAWSKLRLSFDFCINDIVKIKIFHLVNLLIYIISFALLKFV